MFQIGWEKNGLSININETIFILLLREKDKDYFSFILPTIIINDALRENVISTKLFEFKTDENVNWLKHITLI